MIDAYAELRRALIARRAALGYTLKEVAQKMGYSQSTLSSLENGYPRSPLPGILRLWAQALHCDLSFEAVLSYENTNQADRVFDVTPD